MINLFKNRTRKTANALAPHQASELGPDELESVAGGKKMAPPSVASEVGLPGHPDIRYF